MKTYSGTVSGAYRSSSSALDSVDAHHYQELKERMAKATGKEKKLLTAELEGQEEKLTLEKSIFLK